VFLFPSVVAFQQAVGNKKRDLSCIIVIIIVLGLFHASLGEKKVHGSKSLEECMCNFVQSQATSVDDFGGKLLSFRTSKSNNLARNKQIKPQGLHDEMKILYF
jgi:hypothetical protein